MNYTFWSIVIAVGITIACYTVKPFHSTPLDVCLEFGVCVEGLVLKENGKEFVMTKEYCISHNYTWSDKRSSCNTRNITR